MAIGVGILLLGACTHTESPAPQVQYQPHEKSVITRLMHAVETASQARRDLAAIEMAQNPATEIDVNPNMVPLELRRRVSMDYTGTISPLLSQLSREAGYKFTILGTPPASPIIIRLDGRGRALFDILRDLGLQAGRRASVAVIPERRLIELRYEAL